MIDSLPYNYLVLCLFFLSALSLGLEILDRFGFCFHGKGEQAIFSLALGLGAFSNVIFFLGAVQGLYPSICFLILVLPLALCFGRLREAFLWLESLSWKESWQKAPLPVKLGGMAFFFNLLLIVIGASTPPTLSDATNVHLLIPKLYIQNHGFAFLSNVQASNYPCLHVELLYAFCMLLSSDILTQLISVYYLGIMLGGIYLLARSHQSTWVSFGGVLFFFFNMDVVIQSSMAWVDMAWNAYALLAFLLIYRYFVSFKENNEDRKPLFLAGIFCGFAAQIKIFAPVIACIFFFIIVFLLLREGESLSFVLKRTLAFASIAFLVESPYYLKSIWAFGNPIWPFFQEYFGNKNEALAYTAGMFKGPQWRKTGTGLLDFISFPWNIIVSPQLFHSSPLNPFFLALLPLPLIVKIQRPPFLSFLVTFSVFFLLFWFLETPEARFMLVLLGITSIVLTPVAVEISRKERLLGNILKFAAILWIGVITLGNGLIQWKSLPFVSGAIGRDQYIRSQVNGRFSHALEWYDSFVFINKSLRQDAKILFPDTHFYHCDRAVVDLVEAKVFGADGKIGGEASVMDRLMKMGVTHVLTEKESQILEKDFEKYKEFNRFMENQKRLGVLNEIYSKDGIILFEININLSK
ncbi:MAG: hypothetical protein HZA01_10800 [Nitrospinae bacterium]|nr:hypothetical protein [Nitrospinota bacterium]